MSNFVLSKNDAELLREYLTRIDKLQQKEPEQLTAEQWESALLQIQKTGEIPAEYRGRIGVNNIKERKPHLENNSLIIEDGEVIIKGYYDILWESWNSEISELERKYHDVIVKALRYALNTGEENLPLLELLQSLIAQSAGNITDNLFERTYLPMLNGTLVNELMPLTKQDFEPVELTKTATLTTNKGIKVTIENFDKFHTWGVFTKKLFHAAVAHLSDINYFRGNVNAINPTVEMSLIEFGEACNYQLTPRIMATPEEQAEEIRLVEGRIKEFKKTIRRTLNDISSITVTGEEARGKNRHDYQAMRFISSHSIRNNIIRINFDVDAARYLANSFIMQYPRALFAHDNRKPNAYNIGWKIAFHNGLDQNHAAGTECTLSVKSLLDAAPEIPTIEAIKARGQRNWKDKIKKPLEIALDENINVGYLSKWEYRDPKTSQTYTPQAAQALTWTQYYRLMVDFAVIDAPDQTERREARAAEKAAATALKEQNRKKRGRPQKKKEGGV